MFSLPAIENYFQRTGKTDHDYELTDLTLTVLQLVQAVNSAQCWHLPCLRQLP